MRRLTAILLMVMGTPAGFGQAAYNLDRDSGVIKSSGGTWTHNNRIGALNLTLEILINGAPSSSTITVQGCGRGNLAAYGSTNGLNGLPTNAVTCDTLSTYTTNTNGILKLNGLYDSYVVTATWSGGTSPTVQINELETAASSFSPNPPTGASATQVQGTAANGAAIVGNPVLICGANGGNCVQLLVDSSGRAQMVGAAASGAAAAGNPVLIGVGDTNGNVQRVTATAYSVDNQARQNDVMPEIFAMLGLWNGAGIDRVYDAALANMPQATTTTARNSHGAVLTEQGSRFSVPSTPAVSTQASASIAAEASVRHVATGVCFSAGSTTAPALTKLNINLRDGATGAGTILASWTVVIPNATGQNVSPQCFAVGPFVGTTNTAMTLEFSALLTNLFEDVTLYGYNVN